MLAAELLRNQSRSSCVYERSLIELLGTTSMRLFRSISAMFGRMFGARPADDFKAMLLADLGLKQ
ncbi:MAG: hypothetical protein ABUL55_00005 [Pseudomonadota bacterium]